MILLIDLLTILICGISGSIIGVSIREIWIFAGVQFPHWTGDIFSLIIYLFFVFLYCKYLRKFLIEIKRK